MLSAFRLSTLFTHSIMCTTTLKRSFLLRWSLPEIKDCLEEAGFRSVHFWMRSMPNSKEIRNIDGFGVGRDIKYEEVTSFQQQDSWNAYIVGVV